MTKVYTGKEIAHQLNDIQLKVLRKRLLEHGLVDETMTPTKEMIDGGYFKFTRKRINKTNFYEIMAYQKGIDLMIELGLYSKSDSAVFVCDSCLSKKERKHLDPEYKDKLGQMPICSICGPMIDMDKVIKQAFPPRPGVRCEGFFG